MSFVRKRVSTMHMHRNSEINSKRKSALPPPIRLFVSNNKYYTYDLEPIDIHSLRYPAPKSLSPEVEAKLRLIRSSIKEPMILSYQKINQISFKISHTQASSECFSDDFSDHLCKLDSNSMRCFFCGVLMSWLFGVSGVYPPFRILYYEYEEIFVNWEAQNDESITSIYVPIKACRNLILARKFITYMCDRPVGVSFEELTKKYAQRSYFPQSLIKELGLYETKFKIAVFRN